MSPVLKKKSLKKRTLGKASRAGRKLAVERDVNVLEVTAVADIHEGTATLIYGKNGTGKTKISGTYPKPMLLLDCGDKGASTLRNVPGVFVKRIKDWDDFEHVFWFLKKNPDKYKTVSTDTVTQLQNHATRKVLRNAGKPTDNLGDWGTMTQEQWGEVSAMMKQWSTNFCDLAESVEDGGIGAQVLWLAQMRIEEVEQDDPEVEIEPDVGPQVIPSVSQHLQDQCSVIGHTFIRIKTKEVTRKGKTIIKETPQYCMRIGPNPVYRTKLRTDAETSVPDFIVNASYEELQEIIQGE